MRSKFDEQLEQLNNKLIEIGKGAQDIIINATNSFIEQNIQLAKDAIEFYPEIENGAREIEGLCIRLLLKQQPVATDLRVISSSLKVVTDIRRIRNTRNRYCTVSNISCRKKQHKTIS